MLLVSRSTAASDQTRARLSFFGSGRALPSLARQSQSPSAQLPVPLTARQPSRPSRRFRHSLVQRASPPSHRAVAHSAHLNLAQPLVSSTMRVRRRRARSARRRACQRRGHSRGQQRARVPPTREGPTAHVGMASHPMKLFAQPPTPTSAPAEAWRPGPRPPRKTMMWSGGSSLRPHFRRGPVPRDLSSSLAHYMLPMEMPWQPCATSRRQLHAPSGDGLH
mmetsp:Transcript_18318/g.57264  ORF Transcript_18318/g.57264 Transcript_18318/m.57264 type:complete len:221 (+) Transcript_18318:755-1417(+)